MRRENCLLLNLSFLLLRVKVVLDVYTQWKNSSTECCKNPNIHPRICYNSRLKKLELNLYCRSSKEKNSIWKLSHRHDVDLASRKALHHLLVQQSNCNKNCVIHCKWLGEITVRVACSGKRKTWVDSSYKLGFSGTVKSKLLACMEMNFHGLQGLQILRATEPRSSCSASFLRLQGLMCQRKLQL